MLLRRDAESLSDKEKQTLQEAFPGREIEYTRTDPRDYKEHAAQCEEFKPAAVLLPLERPIPSLAMEKGVPHVAITPNGLMELQPLVPSFKAFIPRGIEEQWDREADEILAREKEEAALDKRIDQLATDLAAEEKPRDRTTS
ncbi:MAG: hypothetical protein G01um101438_124 [Parcubacteria group bacterium Gr01-1014_38]|nr:MAG: hypothetical protein G01um101438_124 [Parcubacteria group bacterium Gr01-1014_38]